ncbi:MAG: hypothetical protein JO358_05500 [Alphaproteobacteria bacterium]|nr:hypothetical protein [Alphaproteobacteria bacterium]
MMATAVAILALVLNRLLEPGSKLGAARALSPETVSSSLGQQLGLGLVDQDELYAALDRLAVRQPAIERAVTRNHLTGGTLVALRRLVEAHGRAALARYGYNRDRKARQTADRLWSPLCSELLENQREAMISRVGTTSALAKKCAV